MNEDMNDADANRWATGGANANETAVKEENDDAIIVVVVAIMIANLEEERTSIVLYSVVYFDE